MPTLTTELRNDVLNNEIPVSVLLQKALLLAKELKDKENEQWIGAELKGYPENLEEPDYRTIFGQPTVRDHYTGWQQVYTHNLDPEIAKKLSSFILDAPIGELESYAKEEIVALTYNTEAEQMLMRALNRPGIPAIQFTGIQFQRILDTVRNRILEWVSDLPEETPEAAPREEAPQPEYKPQGLKGFVKENSSWIFQGIGTEVIKWIVGGLMLIGTFLIGYYWNKQPNTTKQESSSTTPSPTTTLVPQGSPQPPVPSASASPEERTLLDVQPEYLLDFFSKYNSAQAQQLVEMYIGKWMKISGEIADVTRIRQGANVVIKTNTATGYFITFSRFDEQRWIDRAVVLKRGEKTTVFGQITRITDWGFTLEKCEFIK